MELINKRHDQLKLDKHPFEGVARITIQSWQCYDDGEEDENFGQVSAVYILTHDDCIKLRDELNKRIDNQHLKQMPKFRKKTVVIEAVQYKGTEDSIIEILALLMQDQPVNLIRVEADGLRINTLEGVMKVNKHDWVIQGVSGEFYPCKPDIFAKTYEPVS